ncbi:MAG TPA: hypothetical protein ENG79_00015 [Desulfobacteraceae bacterium]|nr:hypothetical protein [Desulfobacteraceae bacterium]
MKYCSGNKRKYYLLAGLIALLATDYASAADKKLLPTQQLRPINPGYTVHVPVKVKTPFVPPATTKKIKNKPAKKLAGTIPVSPARIERKAVTGRCFKTDRHPTPSTG